MSGDDRLGFTLESLPAHEQKETDNDEGAVTWTTMSAHEQKGTDNDEEGAPPSVASSENAEARRHGLHNFLNLDTSTLDKALAHIHERISHNEHELARVDALERRPRPR